MYKSKHCNCQIGDKLNRLTVTKIYKKNKHNWVSCQCDCGKQVDITRWTFMTSRTKSCGCLKEEFIKNSPRDNRGRKASSETGKRRCFFNVKRSATTRGLEFNLSFDEVIEMCSKDCFYCENKPETKALNKQAHLRYSEESYNHAQFLYNGIDRVDNSKGYNKDNVVTCCRMCNYMKLNYDVFEWLERIDKISKRKNIIVDTILKKV